MYSPSDPEINCVFCGLGFTSLENVESHIRVTHSSNSAEQTDCRKFTNMERSDQTQCPIDIKHSINNNNNSVLLPQALEIQSMESGTLEFSRKCYKRIQTPPCIREYRCSVCRKQLLCRETIFLHRKIHKLSQKPRFSCTKCGCHFSAKQILEQHVNRDCEIPSELWKYNPEYQILFDDQGCEFCHRLFANTFYADMHKMRVCNKALIDVCQNYDDLINGTDRKWKKSRNNHLDSNSIHLEQAESFDSTTVTSTENSSENGDGRSDSNVKSSQKRKFKSKTKSPADANKIYCDQVQNNKTFQCDVCQKWFSNRSSLSNHIKSHNSRRGQPFVCRDCNKRFVNLLSLQDHRREICSKNKTESGSSATFNLSNFNGVSQVPLWPKSSKSNSSSPPVTCVHCNGIFYDRLKLEEHALTRHSNEQGEILCLLCDRSFTTNMALRVHLTKSHGFANGGCPGISQNLPPLPKLSANYGLVAGSSSRKRRKDKRIFEPDKEYLCENCNRNFSTGQALGNHRRACLNEMMTNESRSSTIITSKLYSGSRSHSIESLISDHDSRKSAQLAEENVFLAFN